MSEPTIDYRRKHLRWGWAGLAVFLSLGLVLEALHGLKHGSYVGLDVETRRTMWRLAHAHGGLIALVHIAFALSCDDLAADRLATPSICLRLALVLLPLGFFAGGAWFHAGDPGLGVLLVPVGGLLFLVGVWSSWRAIAPPQSA
jgi:hypothetical protein